MPNMLIKQLPIILEIYRYILIVVNILPLYLEQDIPAKLSCDFQVLSDIETGIRPIR